MAEPEDLTSDEATGLLQRVLARRRVRLVVDVDLDPIPGWADNPEDWRAMLQRLLNDAASHYNPTVTIAEERA